jgi:hypothetical protein
LADWLITLSFISDTGYQITTVCSLHAIYRCWPLAYNMAAQMAAGAWRHSPMTQKDGYIIEFYQLGNSVKVTAMDPRTLTEVTIVGAPSLPQDLLARNAIRKLEYVMAKARGKPDE